jgi:sugar lactone lactonase YvrE
MGHQWTAGAKILTALAAWAAFGLAAPQPGDFKDGARIVHNVKGQWGSSPKARLEPIRIIGDADTDDDNLAFNMPGELAEDAQGNIYIADSLNARIQKLDKNGKFQATLGRRGQGPGEFASVSSLNIDAEGRLYAFDASQRRVTVLTADGREVRTIRLVKGAISGLRLMKDGAFLVGEPLLSSPKPFPPKILLKVIDEQETVRAEFGSPVDYGEPVTSRVGNSFYFTVGRDNGPVAVFSYQNRIEKYTPAGRIAWRADRPLNFDTKVIEKGKAESTPTTSTFRGPKMNRCSNGVAVDAAGRIWVVTYRRQIKPEEVIRISMSDDPSGTARKVEGDTDLRTTDMFQLDIFDSGGTLLGTMPVSQFVDGIWIHGDRLYLLDRDRGVAYHQYRIVER